MIVFGKTGVIQIDGKYHYVEISTKADPPVITEESPYPVAKPYVEVVFLEETPQRVERFDGNLVQKEDGFYLPGGLFLSEETSQIARYIGKDTIPVTYFGELTHGTALVQASNRTVKLIVNGGVMVGGLLKKVTYTDVQTLPNDKKKGAIEETGTLLFHLNSQVVAASYQKEWCGCSDGNELRTYLMSIEVKDA